MKDKISPYGAEMWSKEVSRAEARDRMRGLAAWCAEHPGLITLAVSAGGFAILLLAYVFQCGRALYFGVPMSEVPVATSILGPFMALVVAAILVASNYYSYLAYKRIDGCSECWKLARRQFGAAFGIWLLLLVLFLFPRCSYYGSNRVEGAADPSLLITVVLLLVLAVLLWFLIWGYGALWAFSESGVKREAESEECAEEAPGQMPQAFGLFLRRKTGEALVHALIPLLFAAFLGYFSCFLPINTVAVYEGSSGRSAISGTESVLPEEYENVASTDKEAGIVVVFSEGNSLCVKPFVTNSTGKMVVDEQKFMWIAKEDVGLEVRNCPVVLGGV